MNILSEKTITILDAKGVHNGVVSIRDTDKLDRIKDLSIETFNAKGERIKEVKKKEINDLSIYDGFSIAADARRKHFSFTTDSFPYGVVSMRR